MRRKTGNKGQGVPSSAIHHPPSTIHHASLGFTLVELLVVIVIISVLVGLLMPAIQAARGRARIAQCSNNQHNLAVAIIGYDGAKRHLPGYANTVKGTVTTWIPVLLEYLGRNDLWADAGGWRYGYVSGTTPSPHIDVLVCPDDPIATAELDAPCLSYTVNVGSAMVLDEPTEYTSDATQKANQQAYQNGVFRNLWLYSSKTISLSSIGSPAQRPMLSERERADGQTGPRLWSTINAGAPTNTLVSAKEFGFNYVSAPALSGGKIGKGVVADNFRPLDSDLITDEMVLPSPAASFHPGIRIVTFCDGHTVSLSDDTVFNVYDYSPLTK